MSTTVTFGPKTSTEILEEVFDFTSELAIGETITTATVAAAVYSGNDSSPAAILSGAALVTGTEVTQFFTGGVVGVVYQVTCEIVTSVGQKLDMIAYLAIEPTALLQPFVPVKPTAPVLSVVAVTSTTVSLAWTPSTEVGGTIGGYTLLINGVPQAPSYGPTVTTAQVTGLSSGQQYTFQIQVFDTSTPQNTNLSNSVVATPPLALQITTGSPLPSGTQGTFYNQSLAATGGTAPYTWFLVSGTLSTGVSLNSSGVISGTPVNAETDNITVRVTDSAGATVTKNFAVTFVTNIAITSSSNLPSGVQNTAYSFTATASGGNPGYTWSIIAGSLPTGLAINSATGKISGTPTGTGTSNWTLQAIDLKGNIATQSDTLTIQPSATVFSFFVAPTYNLNTTGTLGGGVTSATLSAPFPGPTGSSYCLTFPDGEVRTGVTLTNGNTAVSWTGGLTSTQTGTALIVGGNDANPGTVAKPWSVKSLLATVATSATTQGKANNALMASVATGIIMDQGNYSNVYSALGSPSLVSGLNWNYGLMTMPAGTSSKPTVWAACTSGGVISIPSSPTGTGCAMFDSGLTGTPASNSCTLLFGYTGAGGTGYCQISGIMAYAGYCGVFQSFCTNPTSSSHNPGIQVTYCMGNGLSMNATGINPVSVAVFRGAQGDYSGTNTDSFIKNCYSTNCLLTSGDSNHRYVLGETWGCQQVSIAYNAVVSIAGNQDLMALGFNKNTTQCGNRWYNNYIDIRLLTGATSALGSDDDNNAGASSPVFTLTVANNVILMNSVGQGNPWSAAIAGVAAPASVVEQKLFKFNTVIYSGTQVDGIGAWGAANTFSHYGNIIAGAPTSYYLFTIACNANAPLLIDYNYYPVSVAFTAKTAAVGQATWYTGSTNYTFANWKTFLATVTGITGGNEANSLIGNPTFVGGFTYAKAWALNPADPGHNTCSVTGLSSGNSTDFGAFGGTDLETGGPIGQIGPTYMQT